VASVWIKTRAVQIWVIGVAADVRSCRVGCAL